MMLQALVALALAGAPTFSIEQHGTLREAAKAIADKGGINLVISGDLSQSAEVVLKDVTAEEALESIAQAYGLTVLKKGKVWVLKAGAAPAEKAETRQVKISLFDLGEKQDKPTSSRGGSVVVRSGQQIDDVVANGGGVTIEAGAEVTGDVTARGGSIVIGEGVHIPGSVEAYGGSIELKQGAVIEGDATANGGSILKGPGAVINGDAVARGGSVRSIDAAGARAAPVPPVAPLAPLPPMPPAPPGVLLGDKPISPEDIERATQQAQRDVAKAEAEAEAEQARAEALESKLEALRDAQEARADALREAARARSEALRTQAKAARMGEMTRTGPVVVKAGEQVDDVAALGGGVTIESGAKVNGDVSATGGSVVLGEGVHVPGDVAALGGSIELKEGAEISGDATAMGGSIIKGPGARIHGEAIAMGGNVAASIGSQVAKQVAIKTNAASADGEGDHPVASFLLSFALLFGLGFVLQVVAPSRMKAMEEEIANKPALSGVAGLLSVLALAPLLLLLCITLIGIPVALALVMAFPIAVLVSVTAMANLIGSKVPVPKLRRTQAAVLAVGLAALLLAARVPVLGPITMVVVVCVALGAMVRTRFGNPQQGLPMPDMFRTATPSAPL